MGSMQRTFPPARLRDLCPLATTSSPSHQLSKMVSAQAHHEQAAAWCSLPISGMRENGPKSHFMPTGQASTMLGAAKRSTVSRKILAPLLLNTEDALP